MMSLLYFDSILNSDNSELCLNSAADFYSWLEELRKEIITHELTMS